jgi:LssY-like putative type I secretion system component LssY
VAIGSTGLTLAVLTLALAGSLPARAVELPAGTPLSVRLTSGVSSRTSRAGDPVSAVLIAPVQVDDRTVLPAGSPLRGTVLEAGELGGRSILRLDFSELVDEGRGNSPIGTRVVAVDNARESVEEDGRIVGVRRKRRLPTPVAGFLMLLAEDHPIGIAAFAAGRLVLRAAQHTAIDYPPGVELRLALAAPLQIASDPLPDPPTPADPALVAFALGVPFRTQTPRGHRDADVTNLLLVGSQAQVEEAFQSAGWTPARPMCLRARLRGLLALVLKRTDRAAAVSRLDLQGRPPDLVFEKQNDTLTKRHHVRMWREEGPPGRTVWVGAATHDVGVAFVRRLHAFTHRIDPHIDAEREKIVNDLQLTGEVAAAALVDRPRPSGTGEDDVTSAPVETDARMALVVLQPPLPAAQAVVDSARFGLRADGQ